MCITSPFICPRPEFSPAVCQGEDKSGYWWLRSVSVVHSYQSLPALLGQADTVPSAVCVLSASKMLAVLSCELNLSFRDKSALSVAEVMLWVQCSFSLSFVWTVDLSLKSGAVTDETTVQAKVGGETLQCLINRVPKVQVKCRLDFFPKLMKTYFSVTKSLRVKKVKLTVCPAGCVMNWEDPDGHKEIAS